MADDSPAPLAPPAPAADSLFDRIRGWFTNVTNLVTTIGATTAAIAAIIGGCNKARLDQISTDVKDLEFKEKIEKESYDYADFFVKQVLNDTALKNNDKRVQSLLSVLNIVAQASGNKERQSNPRTRAMTPLMLALFLGEPGGVAAMDPSYEYLDDWVAIAYADSSDKTRITAIQALSGICQKALREGRLDVVDKTVEAVDQLFALIPTPRDPTNNLLVPAIAARLQLASFIKKEDRLLEDAKLQRESKPEVENRLREKIRKAFSDSVEKAQLTSAGLQKVSTELGKTQTASSERAKVDQNLAQLNAALANASAVARKETVEPSSNENASGANAATGASRMQAGIADLVKDLENKDAQKQQKAISDLALLGQPAVEPLVDELKRRYSTATSPKTQDLTRISIANALKLMRQPIDLGPESAWWIVSLLSAPEQDARDRAADFLAGSFPEVTLRHIYGNLDLLVEPFLSPNSDEPDFLEQQGVYNTAFVVGTWARSLQDTVQSPEKGKPMNAFAKDKTIEWKGQLQALKKPVWARTISLLQRLSTSSEGKAAAAIE